MSLSAIHKTKEVKGADWHGKVTTCLLYFTMLLHILWGGIPQTTSVLLTVLCVIMMAVSFVMYFCRNVTLLRSGRSSIGFAFFLFGRILPKKMFEHDALPFQLFRFEKGGRIYDALHIRKWKDGFPDMSVLFPDLIPSKKLPKVLTTAQIESMIQETCVAEWIHELLCLFGFGCVFLWEGIGGWLVSRLYALGNLPYIIIQRYNRPKFVRLLKKLQAKEAGCENRKQDHIRGKGTYTELQYGARP